MRWRFLTRPSPGALLGLSSNCWSRFHGGVEVRKGLAACCRGSWASYTITQNKNLVARIFNSENSSTGFYHHPVSPSPKTFHIPTVLPLGLGPTGCLRNHHGVPSCLQALPNTLRFIPGTAKQLGYPNEEWIFSYLRSFLVILDIILILVMDIILILVILVILDQLWYLT